MHISRISFFISMFQLFLIVQSRVRLDSLNRFLRGGYTLFTNIPIYSSIDPRQATVISKRVGLIFLSAGPGRAFIVRYK